MPVAHKSTTAIFDATLTHLEEGGAEQKYNSKGTTEIVMHEITGFD